MDDYEKVQAMLYASEAITVHTITRVDDELEVDLTSDGRRVTVNLSSADVTRIAQQYASPSNP